MKRWVGILSGLLAALSCALGTALLLYVIGWPVREAQMHAWLSTMRTMPYALLTVFFALLLGALGVLTLYGLFSARFEKRTSAPIQRNALGETSIAFTALAQLCEHTAQRQKGVRSCRTKIRTVGDEVWIAVHVITAPSESLLALTHALQEAIAAQIEATVGTKVGRIDVTVDQTDEPIQTGRVQ